MAKKKGSKSVQSDRRPLKVKIGKGSKKVVEEEKEVKDVDSDDEFQFEDSDPDDVNNEEMLEDDDDENEEEEVVEEEDGSEEGISEEKKPEAMIPKESVLSRIKNKIRRRQMYEKYLEERHKEKKAERLKRLKQAELLGEDAPPKQVPRTIENTREPDETTVKEDDPEVKEDEDVDEFSSYFKCEREPKILITTSQRPRKDTTRFCRELAQTIPNSEFRWRNNSSIKKMCRSCYSRGYTDIMIINEDRRKPNAMVVVHLPEGPTAHFKLTGVKYCKQIKHRAKLNEKRPEVILNNFNTRLGHSIGRMFASLFHFDPQFHGRRVVTFHNQRDFIFFRHHRYEFKDGKRVAIQEVGPRFTLKLRWLQKGTFDTKTGEYEWLLKVSFDLERRKN